MLPARYDDDDDDMVSSDYFYLTIIICLHTVKWFQVTNTNPDQ